MVVDRDTFMKIKKSDRLIILVFYYKQREYDIYAYAEPYDMHSRPLCLIV